MKEGEIIAWHYATRKPVCLHWKDRVISKLDAAPHFPPRDLWLAPPLVDVQVNGYAGIDFQQDDLTAEDLLTATRKLQSSGCTKILLTLITDEWPKLMARLRHLRTVRAQSPELQRAIAGWHIEGPFLSAEPGFCGAHNASAMCDPTPAHLHELREAAGNDPVLLTLAPERLDAIAAVSLAVSLGMKVSLGHTNAPRRRIVQAMKAGATGFTHLGNGTPRDLDRHDNVLWRMFETPGLLVGLIPDMIHVSPALFRIMHSNLRPDSIYYTTDAMAAAGAPPGRYKLGRLELEVTEDTIVRLPGKPNFAGSALEPIEGVFRACEMLRGPWQEAWTRLSVAPSKLMGFPSGLEAGQPADFCLLEATPEDRLETLTVYVGGEMVASR